MGWKVALLVGGGVAALALAQQASAEIYMYRDQQGVLHFSNAPADPGYQRWAPRTGGFPVRSVYAVRISLGVPASM